MLNEMRFSLTFAIYGCDLRVMRVVQCQPGAMILPGYQTSDSVHLFALLALLVALVLRKGDSVDFNFTIL